jgi:Surfeit locus protein 6
MMKLAKGEKVLDDPKLLKRSLKRMQKDKQKSKEGWKVRTDAVRKKQADRQEKYVSLHFMYSDDLLRPCCALELATFAGDSLICRRRWTKRRRERCKNEKSDFSAQGSKVEPVGCGHECLFFCMCLFCVYV